MGLSTWYARRGAGGAGRPRSAPLALATLLERDDLAPRLDVGKILGQLFGDAEQALAPLHLAPYVVRTHARRNPQHDEIVDEVGALAHDCVAVAVHGVDDDLDRLFGELLGHLGAASTQQAGRTRSRRIRLLGGRYGVIQPVDRITHTQTITRLAVYCVNNVIMPLDLGVTSPDCLSTLVHRRNPSGGASPATTSRPLVPPGSVRGVVTVRSGSVTIRGAVVAIAAIWPVRIVVPPVVAAGLLIGDDAANGAGNGAKGPRRRGVAAPIVPIMALACAQFIGAGSDDARLQRCLGGTGGRRQRSHRQQRQGGCGGQHGVGNTHDPVLSRPPRGSWVMNSEGPKRFQPATEPDGEVMQSGRAGPIRARSTGWRCRQRPPC